MEESSRRATADCTAKSWQDDEDAKVYRINQCGGFKATEIALSAKRTVVRRYYDKYKCVCRQDKQVLQYLEGCLTVHLTHEII